MKFFGEKSSKCLGIAMKRNIYKEIRDINLRIDFKVLKVQVPFRFLGTVGFSPRREGR